MNQSYQDQETPILLVETTKKTKIWRSSRRSRREPEPTKENPSPCGDPEEDVRAPGPPDDPPEDQTDDPEYLNSLECLEHLENLEGEEMSW
jgi:hypothetical protein